jgi:hypothetical protein
MAFIVTDPHDYEWDDDEDTDADKFVPLGKAGPNDQPTDLSERLQSHPGD